MKMLVCSLAVMTLLLAACAASEEKAQVAALYNKYNAHCLEHAKQAAATASPDEDSLYRECMNYFIGSDVHCPYCTVEKGMSK